MQTPPVKEVAAISVADELRTKQTFERLLPDMPAAPTTANYADWLAHVDAYIQQHNSVIINNKNNSNNNISNNSNSSEPPPTISKVTAESSTTTTKPVKIANGNSSSADDLSATTEDLILQNAKLQGTVSEYKTIVAETVSILNTFFYDFFIF